MNKEYLKKRLVDLRAAVTKERELKKRETTRIAETIKALSSAESKAHYKKRKIDVAAAHDKNIERLKAEIEKTQAEIKKCK